MITYIIIIYIIYLKLYGLPIPLPSKTNPNILAFLKYTHQQYDHYK